MSPLHIAGLLAALAALLPRGADAAHVEHRVRIEGVGTPVVVLENGLGDSFEVWDEVQPALARGCALTFAYNRAGYDGSGAAYGIRDAHAAVSELRAELRQRGLRPPYVLVGHSLGGLYMQYFARTFADEVAGLVLVDSTHWSQRLWPIGNEGRGPGHVVLFLSPIARRELAGSAAAGEQVRASPPAPRVPTIVLSSTGVLRGETPAMRLEGARRQEELANEFPDAQLIRVDTGHYIQKERPDAVIEAIHQVAGCRRSPR